MGLADRDYYRQPTRRSGFDFGGWGVNGWLIAINVVVFFVGTSWFATAELENGQTFRYQPVYAWGAFSLDTAVYSGQVWRFLTFQFLHGGVNHIVFNMIGLFFFGRLVEQYLGSGRYLAFYLISGIGGPIAYVLLYYLGILNYAPGTPLVGASAGLFGVLIGCAVIAPNARVQLLFPPVEMTMRTMAFVYIGIAVAVVFMFGQSGQGNAGGEAAHLGGAAVGYLLIRNPQWLSFAALGSRNSRMRLGR